MQELIFIQIKIIYVYTCIYGQINQLNIKQ
jgi:hypothetical protein